MNTIKTLTLAGVVADFVINLTTYLFKLYIKNLTKTDNTCTAYDIDDFQKAFEKIHNEKLVPLLGTTNIETDNDQVIEIPL